MSNTHCRLPLLKSGLRFDIIALASQRPADGNPRPFRADAVSQRRIAFLGAADGRENDPTPAGWLGSSVEHLPGLLSSHFARRLSLCARDHLSIGPTPPSGTSRGRSAASIFRPSDKHSRRVDSEFALPRAGGNANSPRVSGVAAFLGIRERAIASALDSSHVPPRRAGPLLPLCRKQPGKSFRSDRLSLTD